MMFMRCISTSPRVLTDSVMRVKNFISMKIDVHSRMTQGSHLVLLLFNIYVNNISSCFLYSKFLTFAEELKFYNKVDGSEDCLKLQVELNRLFQWYNHKAMELNVKAVVEVRSSILTALMSVLWIAWSRLGITVLCLTHDYHMYQT